MKETGTSTRVTGLLERAAVANGFELVLAEFAGHANAPIIRVYLDRDGGIGIDDIANANSWIKDVLDAQPEYHGDYSLEVSSPGIDRPLVKLGDFTRFAGSDAKITTTGLVEGRKHFTGRLIGVEGEDVLIDVDGTTFRIPHGSVRTARLRVEIDFNKED